MCHFEDEDCDTLHSRHSDKHITQVLASADMPHSPAMLPVEDSLGSSKSFASSTSLPISAEFVPDTPVAESTSTQLQSTCEQSAEGKFRGIEGKGEETVPFLLSPDTPSSLPSASDSACHGLATGPAQGGPREMTEATIESMEHKPIQFRRRGRRNCRRTSAPKTSTFRTSTKQKASQSISGEEGGSQSPRPSYDSGWITRFAYQQK